MELKISPCPHCQGENMPTPRKMGGTVFETCPDCHKTARAKFIQHEGKRQVVYLTVRKVARMTRPVRVLAELADLLASDYGAQGMALEYLRADSRR